MSAIHRPEHVRRLLAVLPHHGAMAYRRAVHEASLPGQFTSGVRKDLLARGLVAEWEDGLELTDLGRAERERQA